MSRKAPLHIIGPVVVLSGFIIYLNALYPSTSSHQIVKRSQIHYQSAKIPFPEWLSQLTLCFAPYAAHMLIGVPTIIPTTVQKPKPYHLINFLNPMTIVWRYIMICDRRIRSTTWCAEDLAASNCAFYTSKGWDGSSAIMMKSRKWVTQRPTRARVSWLSVSMLGTLITTMQGLQAFYQAFSILWTHISPIQGIAELFLPLAMGSLFRLPAAMWLLGNEFGYDAWKRDNNIVERASEDQEGDVKMMNMTIETADSTWPLRPAPRVKTSGLRPQTYWKAILFRIVYIAALLFIIFAFGVGHLVAKKDAPSNVSLTLQHYMYSSFILILLVLSIYWFVSQQGDDTMIPCINSTWYTCFTIMWYLYALVCIIVNCIELRRTECGVYTTFTKEQGLDERLCKFYRG